MKHIPKTILITLIQCILQSRVEVQKKQIRRFDEINKQLQKKHEKAFDGNLEQLCNHLLLQEKFKIRDLIKFSHEHHYICISLTLCDRFNKKNCIMSELWTITFDQYLEFEEQYSSEEYIIISTLFQQMLLFLNQQPLFSEYQRNSKLKDRYSINYQIQVLNESPVLTDKSINILDLGNKYIKQRVCKYLGVNIVCYFLPKSENCWNNFDNQLYFQNKSNKSRKEEKTCDTIHKARKQSQEYSSGKLSYYQIYDKQLDFVFLSSDDEEFRKYPESQIKEVDLDLEESEQFQLLMLTKDEELANDSKDAFTEMLSIQKQYLIV